MRDGCKHGWNSETFRYDPLPGDSLEQIHHKNEWNAICDRNESFSSDCETIGGLVWQSLFDRLVINRHFDSIQKGCSCHQASWGRLTALLYSLSFCTYWIDLSCSRFFFTHLSVAFLLIWMSFSSSSFFLAPDCISYLYIDQTFYPSLNDILFGVSISLYTRKWMFNCDRNESVLSRPNKNIRKENESEQPNQRTISMSTSNMSAAASARFGIRILLLLMYRSGK